MTAGYTRRSRELDGYGLVNDLYGSTTMFSGFDPRDVTTILQSQTRMEREEDIFDVRASLKVAGPFSVRIGYSENQSDILVLNDPSEVVVAGGQGGQYDRRVGTFDGGLLFKLSGLSLGVDYVTQNADNAVMRTDFLDRDRIRVRGAWEAAKWLRIGATAEQIDTENADAGYGLDGKVKTYAGDLEVGPWNWLRLRFGMGRFESDNSIAYRIPQTFATATSVYAEKGDSLEGGLTVNFKPFTLEAQLRRFENEAASRTSSTGRGSARASSSRRCSASRRNGTSTTTPRRTGPTGPSGLQGQPVRPLPAHPPVNVRSLPRPLRAPAERRGRFLLGLCVRSREIGTPLEAARAASRTFCHSNQMCNGFSGVLPSPDSRL
ncbi:MAG: hypothetical protein IPF66_24160 [Holophagales bacterium]|nr:hypothetical protein [Holophagales bacterium]